jgi:CBS domain-containing protein
MASDRTASSPRRTGPFGPAGEILPQSQKLECLHPNDTLLVALERLCDAGFNQAPVRDANECIGVLRFFQVMQQLLEQQWFRDKLRNMPMRNHVDLNPRYIGVDDWVDVGFDWQGDDLALVGTPRDLRGMLTATDILRRLTDYAQAFVHLESIELDTRALFNSRLPLPESLEIVISALTAEGRVAPREFSSYDQLDFGQYGLIFGREVTFARLSSACIWDRIQLVRKTKRVGDIRNMLLHFRGRASAREVGELEQFAWHAAKALERASVSEPHVAVEQTPSG